MDDEATSSQLLVDLARAENELLESYAENIKNSAVGYQHFYMFGIARRTLAQSRAFKACIEDRKALVELALTRLQLGFVAGGGQMPNGHNGQRRPGDGSAK
jgi:hypothetical protein